MIFERLELTEQLLEVSDHSVGPEFEKGSYRRITLMNSSYLFNSAMLAGTYASLKLDRYRLKSILRD